MKTNVSIHGFVASGLLGVLVITGIGLAARGPSVGIIAASASAAFALVAWVFLMRAARPAIFARTTPGTAQGEVPDRRSRLIALALVGVMFPLAVGIAFGVILDDLLRLALVGVTLAGSALVVIALVAFRRGR